MALRLILVLALSGKMFVHLWIRDLKTHLSPWQSSTFLCLCSKNFFHFSTDISWLLCNKLPVVNNKNSWTWTFVCIRFVCFVLVPTWGVGEVDLSETRKTECVSAKAVSLTDFTLLLVYLYVYCKYYFRAEKPYWCQ